MTPDEIITTLAELEGWKFWQNKYGTWVVTSPSGTEMAIPGTVYEAINPTIGRNILARIAFPNYLCPTTGLSHCRRVQLLLTDEQHEDFRRRLKWAIANELGESTLSDKVRRAYISASASQVAQALAATIRREGL